MEILKSKINQFPNYFLSNYSRNRNSNNKINKYSSKIFNTSCNFIKTKNNPKEKLFHIVLKDIETQTSVEKNNYNNINNNNSNSNRDINNNNNININNSDRDICKNNNHHKMGKRNIKPYMIFENKTLKNFISSYSTKTKSNHQRLFLDKISFSYFPKKELSFIHNKIKNNNNKINIKSIKSIKKEKKEKNQKSNLKIEINEKLGNIKRHINNKKNRSFRINKSFYQKYFERIISSDNYKDYKDTEYNIKIKNPVLIKDIEISKLL